MARYLIVLLVFLFVGCARTSTIPITNNMVQISTSAAVVCGATGAQRVALERAAIETLNRGFDRFVIVGGAYANNVRKVGQTPVIAKTTGTADATLNTYGNTTYGTVNSSSTTTFTGGQPIVGGSHDQSLMVQMYKPGDAGFDQGVDAKQTLGPDWQEKIAKRSVGTC